MSISVFQLFSIGIGPSSSHTVGPMRAALQFAKRLEKKGHIQDLAEINVDVYGSLALTGKGHGADSAILLGLEGETPEEVDPNLVKHRVRDIRKEKKIQLLGKHAIPFIETSHFIFHKDKILPRHPNGMRFTALNKQKKKICSEIYYSIGGGFIVDHKAATQNKQFGEEGHPLPLPFKTSKELLEICQKKGLSIAEVVMANEKTWYSEKQVKERVLHIWNIMKKCVEKGCQEEGILAGGLNVQRRAAGLYRHLVQEKKEGKFDPVSVMKWVSLWALAVNEENAAGSRIVTAPTNGSSGIIPAVLHFYEQFTESPNEDGITTFLLTAGAIGTLYKVGASIAAAEMGCMGEAGVACAMAAAGLTAAQGATNAQFENAAEIGMEHNLGLTCDPVLGLVQIPCIERNAMGAVKAINASILALEGDGSHRVSLNQVIATMRQTGKDMQSIYKETSLGGLAVNVPEC
ncbi:MAG: L-serine ammonia-lyase [Waddliaceae bacterium]